MAGSETVRVRWWPLVVIAAALVVALVLVRGGGGADRQEAFVGTLVSVVVASLAVLVWLLFGARLPRRRRGQVAALVAIGLAGFFGAFRFVGVTGDLVPIFEPRWTPRATPPEAGPRAHAGRLPVPAGAADFPQFFGPARDGTLAGPALEVDWKAHPPEQLWRHPVGEGWSGFAVQERRAVTQEQHGEREMVVCYDLESGEVAWSHGDETRFADGVAGNGPRATPAIAGERVYTVGSTGVLNCLDLATGQRRWMVNALEASEAEMPIWGLASSPLVVDGEVVLITGGARGSVVAFDADDGTVTWRGGDETAHWSSPQAATFAGTRQVLAFQDGLNAYAPGTGEVLWSFPWKGEMPRVCLPMPLPDDRVLVSSGYGVGARMLQVRHDPETGWSVDMLWRSLAMKAKFTNVVVHEGCAYGFDDGILACIGLDDGRRRWKRGRHGHGQVLLVGETLLVSGETGEVLLVAASPEGYRELAKMPVFDHKAWNPPALAGRFLLLRTDREAVCYRLPVRG